jgi:hypothetical protein
MPIDAPRPEFRPLAPWPPGIRFLDGPVERILQNQLPPRPDGRRSCTGSTAGLTADSTFAERGPQRRQPFQRFEAAVIRFRAGAAPSIIRVEIDPVSIELERHR